ncbi:MAG: hypothetical protein HYX84_02790 [Chloroflexi bacterium]|nr:hypothetical protein [Chloroflexota bacterium]
MHIIQTPLFDFDTFIAKRGNDRLLMVLEALPAEGLIATLEREQWTGRKGYSVTVHMERLLRKAGADREETKPLISIREREGEQLPDICNAKGRPCCSCGLEMVYRGKDGKYLKYRCPHELGKAECKSRFRCTSSAYGYVLKLPVAADPRRQPPLPRETKKRQKLYRMRTAIERVKRRVKEILGLGAMTLKRHWQSDNQSHT